MDRRTEKPLACEECYLSKKCCTKLLGKESCERCIFRKTACYPHERKPYSQKGRVRGFYKKTLLRAQYDLSHAKKRRQKYCREKECNTGFRPSILPKSVSMSCDPGSSASGIVPSIRSTEVDYNFINAFLGGTADLNPDSSPTETPKIGMGGLSISSPPYYSEAGLQTIPEMIQQSIQQSEKFPSEGFAKSQSDGLALQSGECDMSIFSIPFSSTGMISPPQAQVLPPAVNYTPSRQSCSPTHVHAPLIHSCSLPHGHTHSTRSHSLPSTLFLDHDHTLHENISELDSSVADVFQEPGGGLDLCDPGVQSLAPESEDDLGGLLEMFQFENPKPEVVLVEGNISFESDLALPPKPNRIICEVPTNPPVKSNIPLYVPLSEQGGGLKTMNTISEKEYDDLEDLFIDHD